MNAVRRLGSAPGVRRLALHPRVRTVGASLLATRFLVSAFHTTTPWQFLAGEVANRGETRTYRTRSGMPVSLQHGRDAEALFELFVRGEYVPPDHLAGRLSVGRTSRIIDVGANVGMFSAWAAQRWPQAEILAFEPIASNCAVYREWQRVSGAKARLIQAAAGTGPGRMTMVDWGGGSHLAGDGDPGEDVECVDIFDYLSKADLIKMDIEGGEWAILSDPRLANVKATLVLEYHRVGSPTLPARAAAEELLRAAGFETGFGAQNFWGHGTLWAWKDDAPR